ncbi:Palmitoyl-monogalactosyldiacylglycerol delta-7 desaturase, chloroplastic [Glycine soja]|uniref:Palmitoyl-monogalactosyldiacylglycerol delta-7 desaturase, chloroplastic n=1 Tax=Glycine soja TaxID=3848 RepID=A0A0B2Q668_GLYSO|nr:Palmitoyl-monogalactosyldiacylglycerol delta-7 desaturase, chloroplastic [Glycine soja]
MSWLFDTTSILERCGEANNVGDLEKQSFYRFLRSTYLAHPFALGALLYAAGGFPFLVWGMGVRIVWVYHITWFLNSACHVWGIKHGTPGTCPEIIGGWRCLHLVRVGTITTMLLSTQLDMDLSGGN